MPSTRNPCVPIPNSNVPNRREPKVMPIGDTWKAIAVSPLSILFAIPSASFVYKLNFFLYIQLCRHAPNNDIAELSIFPNETDNIPPKAVLLDF